VIIREVPRLEVTFVRACSGFFGWIRLIPHPQDSLICLYSGSVQESAARDDVGGMAPSQPAGSSGSHAEGDPGLNAFGKRQRQPNKRFLPTHAEGDAHLPAAGIHKRGRPARRSSAPPLPPSHVRPVHLSEVI